MAVIYTAQPIKPYTYSQTFASRMAREALVAMIEEEHQPSGLVTSFGLAPSTEFPFPNERPNANAAQQLFGANTPASVQEKEIHTLLEVADHEDDDFERQVEDASAAELLGLARYYRDGSEDVEARRATAYNHAETILRDPLTPEELRTTEHNQRRSELTEALRTLNDFTMLGATWDLQRVRELLDEGKIDGVRDVVKDLYREWRADHAPTLTTVCRDALEGAGFWIARLVTPDEALYSARRIVEGHGLRYEPITRSRAA